MKTESLPATAVMFGAGNIGRGFIAQLFHESGFEVVFIDVNRVVVDALNQRRGYTIRIVGPHPDEIPISNVCAIHGSDVDAVAEAVSHASLVATAVGAGALPYIAPALARGVILRKKLQGCPLNVLICENLHNASDALRKMLVDSLVDLGVGDIGEILETTGLSQAVVSRMVPLQTPDDNGGDPLAIRVEAYKRLPVDASHLVAPLPKLVGVEAVSNFDAYVDCKLYIHNCAHAVLGYAGWHYGLDFGYDALDHPEVFALLNGVLKESGGALIIQHGLNLLEHSQMVADLIERFRNRDLGDTCFRLARDPLRKLAPDDRLVGAARLCEHNGLACPYLARAIALAYRFDAEDDPVAVAMQHQILQQGLAGAMQSVSRIMPDEPLGIAVRIAFDSWGSTEEQKHISDQAT